MEFRGVLVLALVSAALAAASSSCSSVDPSTVNFEEKPKQQDIVADGGSSSGSSGGGEAGAGDGGSDAGGEAGGPVNAFTGAKPYDSATAGMKTGSNNMNPSHMGFGATRDPAGRVCIDCHVAGNPLGATPFALAGTVNNAMTAGKPLTTHAEIRVVDAAGKEVFSTYSDELGNFWAEPVGAAIAAGASVGIRNGTSFMLMSTKLAGPGDGSCSQAKCHGAGGNPGYLPFLQ